MTEKLISKEHPIILFDGYCNLCSSSVQFILKRDKKKLFRYAPLQSDFGKSKLIENGLTINKIDTLVLIENDTAYTYSTGALKIARQLDGWWPLLYAGIIIPRFLRDLIYQFIAKNRYKWFGKTKECFMIPSND